MIKYLITIVLTVALCCALRWRRLFSRSYHHAPATQTGANTFGCLIDLLVYTGQRYGLR